jgi:hypothetical protein
LSSKRVHQQAFNLPHKPPKKTSAQVIESRASKLNDTVQHSVTQKCAHD